MVVKACVAVCGGVACCGSPRSAVVIVLVLVVGIGGRIPLSMVQGRVLVVRVVGLGNGRSVKGSEVVSRGMVSSRLARLLGSIVAVSLIHFFWLPSITNFKGMRDVLFLLFSEPQLTLYFRPLVVDGWNK